LGGDEASVGDDAAKLPFVGAVFYAGGEDYIFFDEDAADVVGAELQTDLADFDSRREPAGLDVVNVVEIQSADGERFQVVDSRGLLHFSTKGGVVRGEHPRDKRGEAAGVFLNAADALEVIHAVTQFFSTAEHHGGRGAQSERVGDAMDFFPFLAGAFEAGDACAPFVVEDFRAAAGNGL